MPQHLPTNLRIWRFVFFIFAWAAVGGGAAALLKDMLGVPVHSQSARGIDAMFEGLVVGVPFVVLRQFKEGAHSWLRR